MEIPHRQLSDEALLGVIEEYISREGTDYGHREYSFEEKIEKVRSQLIKGEIKLLFDSKTASGNLEKSV